MKLNFNWLQKLGPGILFAGAAIGVSHLVQATRAGAEFGFGLLWALVLIHVLKYPFFQFGPRYTTATNESLLHGYRRLGKWVLISYFIISLASMFTIQAAVTIVTAGLAANLFGVTTDPVMWSTIIILLCAVLLGFGKYKLLDRFMKVIIIVLTVSTIAAVGVALSQNDNPLSFEQYFPTEALELTFLIAFLGWMPAPLDVSIWQSLWTEEKRKNKQITFNTKQAIFDFNIGFVGTLIVGISFMALGTLVMYNSGNSFDSGSVAFANQLIELYTTNLGSEFWIVISIAAFTAMFSTTITTLDASPRAMDKTIEILLKRKNKNGYWYWLVLLAVGTIIIFHFFLSEMGTLVKIATIFSFLTTPFFAITNYVLITGKHTPKEMQPSKGLKTLSLTGIVFLIGFALWYLFSL